MKYIRKRAIVDAEQYFACKNIHGVFFDKILNQAYIRLKMQNISLPLNETDWIINESDGRAYIYSDEDFKENFEILKVPVTPNPPIGNQKWLPTWSGKWINTDNLIEIKIKKNAKEEGFKETSFAVIGLDRNLDKENCNVYIFSIHDSEEEAEDKLQTIMRMLINDDSR